VSVSALDNGVNTILSYAPTPVRTGFTLTGWAYDEAGTSMVSSETVITVADTLYAIWEEDGA